MMVLHSLKIMSMKIMKTMGTMMKIYMIMSMNMKVMDFQILLKDMIMSMTIMHMMNTSKKKTHLLQRSSKSTKATWLFQAKEAAWSLPTEQLLSVSQHRL